MITLHKDQEVRLYGLAGLKSAWKSFATLNSIMSIEFDEHEIYERDGKYYYWYNQPFPKWNGNDIMFIEFDVNKGA